MNSQTTCKLSWTIKQALLLLKTIHVSCSLKTVITSSLCFLSLHPLDICSPVMSQIMDLIGLAFSQPLYKGGDLPNSTRSWTCNGLLRVWERKTHKQATIAKLSSTCTVLLRRHPDWTFVLMLPVQRQEFSHNRKPGSMEKRMMEFNLLKLKFQIMSESIVNSYSQVVKTGRIFLLTQQGKGPVSK